MPTQPPLPPLELPPLRPLHVAEKLRQRQARAELTRCLEQNRPIRLHIGCGAHLLPGWINLDQRPRPGAFYVDARYPLPLASAQAQAVFHEHFLEHLSQAEGLAFLRELWRILRPGGVMRLSTPDLRKVVSTYLDQNPAVARAEALSRHARLLHLAEATPARFLNDKLRAWGHQYLYDQAELEQALRAAGFQRLEGVSFGQSQVPFLQGLERHADVPWMETAEPLILEAWKDG